MPLSAESDLVDNLIHQKVEGKRTTDSTDLIVVSKELAVEMEGKESENMAINSECGCGLDKRPYPLETVLAPGSGVW